MQYDTLKFTKGRAASLDQIQTTYRVVSEILESLDDVGLKQLMAGNEKDTDQILDVLLEETFSVLTNTGGRIKLASFGYMDKLYEATDDAFRNNSLAYFILTTLPKIDLTWYHLEWCNMIQMHKKLRVLASRDHSKSFIFSWAYPIWNMWRYERPGGFINPGFERSKLCHLGIIITNVFKLSKYFLKMIMDEIEQNEILKAKLKPTGRGGWGNEGLTAKNGAVLMPGAFDTALRGFHPGYIVVDDFLDKSALYSAERRIKFNEVFFSEIVNMLLPKGHLKVVGTPFHEKDLYADIAEDKSFISLEYPAIFPDGTILYPGRYDFDLLMQRKESLGSLKFSREFLVKPVSSDATIFPYDIVSKSFIGMDIYKLVRNRHSFGKKFVKVAIGCDFAISSNIGADYTVFSVLGQDELDNIYLLWLYREKGATYDKQIGMLKALNVDFSPDLIVIENNGYQKVMYQMALESNLPVIEKYTGVDKYDYDIGLPALATMFEQGRFKFPRGDAFSRDMTDAVVSEFTSITWHEKGKLESASEHDDIPMSIWQGVKGLRYVNSGFSFDFI